MQSISSAIFILLGGFSLILGIFGMFLPILPTTPFLILSAYFFSRGSKKIHNWILSSPFFGKIIKDWENYGVINKKAKIQAILAILLFFPISIFLLKHRMILKIALILIGISVGHFIITRPSKISNF